MHLFLHLFLMIFKFVIIQSNYNYIIFDSNTKSHFIFAVIVSFYSCYCFYYNNNVIIIIINLLLRLKERFYSRHKLLRLL